MGTITIDGRKVEFTDEKNVLTIIRKAGIDIPTLCYHSELSTFGACRLCTVEDDRGRMFASCSEEPRDGMVIYTNTGKLKKYRKLIIELLLAAHCRDCTTCVKSGDCNLQTLAHRFNVTNVRFENYKDALWISVLHPSYATRISVYYAGTVCASVRNCRESAYSGSRTAALTRWL